MRPRSPCTRPRRHPGLTLIELMVSLLLAIILTGGLFFMMSGQQRTYNEQLSTMTSQENLWGAMEYLATQIRRAGYGFGGCIPSYVNGYATSTVMMWNGATTGTPPLIKPSFLVAIDFHNNSNLFSNSIDGTDSIMLAFADDSSTNALTAVRTVGTTPDPVSCTLTTNDATGISANDLVVLWQPGSIKHCLLLQITAAPALSTPNWVLTYNGGNVYNPGAPTHLSIFPVDSGYQARSMVTRVGSTTSLLTQTFAIDDGKGTRPPRLVTWRKTDKSDVEVVADGIEDMQVAWACDANGDGWPQEGATDAARRTDEWSFNVTSDSVPACQTLNNPVSSVRITLIGRTVGPIQSRKGFRPAAEDHAAGTAAQDLAATGSIGTFGRAVLTSIVKPRNVAKSLK